MVIGAWFLSRPPDVEGAEKLEGEKDQVDIISWRQLLKLFSLDMNDEHIQSVRTVTTFHKHLKLIKNNQEK